MALKGIDLANPPDLVRLAVPRSRESRVVIAGSRKAHGPEDPPRRREVGISDSDLVEPRLERLPEREGTPVELNTADGERDARSPNIAKLRLGLGQNTRSLRVRYGRMIESMRALLLPSPRAHRRSQESLRNRMRGA
jgi:hypothetical protein